MKNKTTTIGCKKDKAEGRLFYVSQFNESSQIFVISTSRHVSCKSFLYSKFYCQIP